MRINIQKRNLSEGGGGSGKWFESSVFATENFFTDHGINLNLGRHKKDTFKSFFRRRNLRDIIKRRKNSSKEYIYIHIRFQKGFHTETDIYFCFLARKLCAFFTCHCPTCEKSRFKDKFTLRQVLCSNLTKRECTKNIWSSRFL